MGKLSKEQLIDKFLESPVFAEMQEKANREEEDRQRRADVIRELPELQRQRIEMIFQHKDELTGSAERVKQAQKVLDEARRAAAVMGSRQHAELFLLDTKIAKLELFLSQTAPKALKAQIDKLEEEIRQIQAEPFTSVLKDAWDASKAYVETDYQDKVARINGLYGKIEALKREIMTGGVQ